MLGHLLEELLAVRAHLEERVLVLVEVVDERLVQVDHERVLLVGRDGRQEGFRGRLELALVQVDELQHLLVVLDDLDGLRVGLEQDLARFDGAQPRLLRVDVEARVEDGLGRHLDGVVLHEFDLVDEGLEAQGAELPGQDLELLVVAFQLHLHGRGGQQLAFALPHERRQALEALRAADRADALEDERGQAEEVLLDVVDHVAELVRAVGANLELLEQDVVQQHHDVLVHHGAVDLRAQRLAGEL